MTSADLKKMREAIDALEAAMQKISG